MFSWFRAGVIKEVAFKNVSPLLFFLFFFSPFFIPEAVLEYFLI